MLKHMLKPRAGTRECRVKRETWFREELPGFGSLERNTNSKNYRYGKTNLSTAAGQSPAAAPLGGGAHSVIGNQPRAMGLKQSRL